MIIVIFTVLLLIYKPAGSKVINTTDEQCLSKYLTNQLAPAFYNGLERNEPFDLVITQQGINDIIAHQKWPRQINNTKFHAPNLYFVSGSIVLMGTVELKNIDLAATIIIVPSIDQQGMLSVKLKQVKIGAVTVTPLAKIVAARLCQNYLSENNIDPQTFGVKLAEALLKDKPFDPSFKIEDKHQRIEKIKVAKRQLIVTLTPIIK